MFVPVTPEHAQALIASGEIDVIDVRGPEEWKQGHLPGARLVSLAELREDPRSALVGNGVLFVCAGGVRSQTAARIAVDHGMTRVYSLTGGTRSWVKAGLPIEQTTSSAA